MATPLRGERFNGPLSFKYIGLSMERTTGELSFPQISHFIYEYKADSF